MPFTNTQSIVAADLNNMWRGLYRDNTDHAHTGNTNETDLASVSITGGTITATGGLHVLAAGTTTTAGGTKRVRLYFGATAIGDTTAVTGTGDWFFEAWIYNTAANAQRCLVLWSTHNSATNFNQDYITAAIDTASAVTLKCTGLLAAGGDTVTQTMFDVSIIQIT